MTSFPTLTPGGRTFTPGQFPHSSFAALNGRSNRVRNSNVILSSQLRLTFAAITESQMLSILTHYQGRQGTFQSFPLPTAIWSGVSSINDYQLSGYGWRYIEPPSVTDAMCANAYDVELTLETVPPEGTALLGIDSFVRVQLTAGVATATFDFSVAVLLAAGSATAGATLPGLDETVTWTLSEAVGDPDFANVSLLLHMDGSNGSTTIVDSSSNGHIISVFGNAKLTTSDKKYGTAALTLDGTGDYLTVPAGSGFQLGTGDFTVECWCKPAVISGNDGLFTFGGTSSGLSVSLYQNNWYLGTSGGGGTLMGSASSDLNVWRHVAVTRSGTSLRMFIDGTQKGSTITNSANLSDNQLKVGYYYSSSFPFNGLIDEFRVTKGVARWTANFTPPTAPFPDS